MKIEKAIPIPELLRAPRPCSYPFGEMEIGDSFMVAATAPEAIRKAQQNIRAHATRYADNECASFAVTLRLVPGGVRCWRVEFKEKTPRRAKAKTAAAVVAAPPPISIPTIHATPTARAADSYIHDADKGRQPVGRTPRPIKGSQY